MGLLPWSFGFLLIISILSWSAIGRMSEETLVTRSIVTSVQKQAEELTRKITSKSKIAYRQYREKNGKTAPDDEEEEEEGEAENAKKTRGPPPKRRLTSKLHISSLFSNEDNGQKATQEKLFRNLLKALYEGQHLFVPRGNNGAYVQQLFDEVKLRAIEWGPKLPMTNAAFLANVELTGYKKEERQFILFLILKGGEGELFRGVRCYVRPLLSFISMNKKDFCMNVYLAPVAVLMALFENPDVVEKVVEARRVIGKKIQEEKDNPVFVDGNKKDILEVLSDEFKSQFESSIPSGIEPQYIDFHVSRTIPKNF